MSRRRKPGDRVVLLLSLTQHSPHIPQQSTASDIAKEILISGESSPTIRTICYHLLVAGRRLVQKPFVSAKNRKVRVEWTKAHLNWTPQQWSSVIWSDESKFLLYDTDGITWIRPKGKRFDPKYQLLTMKHGGGSIIGYFLCKGNRSSL